MVSVFDDEGPLLRASKVNTTVSPISNSSGAAATCPFSSSTSALRVTSTAAESSFGCGSPEGSGVSDATAAVFVRVPAARVGAKRASNSMTGAMPRSASAAVSAGRPAASVKVTTCGVSASASDARTIQGPTEVSASSIVTPSGRVSVTTIGPTASLGPKLRTCRRYQADSPASTPASAIASPPGASITCFSMPRSAAATTATVAASSSLRVPALSLQVSSAVFSSSTPASTVGATAAVTRSVLPPTGSRPSFSAYAHEALRVPGAEASQFHPSPETATSVMPSGSASAICAGAAEGPSFVTCSV